jgi:hypothetical protein
MPCSTVSVVEMRTLIIHLKLSLHRRARAASSAVLDLFTAAPASAAASLVAR